MNTLKSILVTGCAGFIGAEVSRTLIKQGKHVVGVDNMNDYYDVSLKKHRLESIDSDQFKFRKMDLENRNEVRRLFDDYSFDAVINLAARAGVRYSIENPHVYMTTNIIGSLNLLEKMHDHGTKKYVSASTSSLYAGQEMPFLETSRTDAPTSPYAASKKAAELLAYTYHHLSGLDVSVCRYFTVYGPASRPDMGIFRFIRWIDSGVPIQLFGDGTQSRDFTFVSDIAKGTVAALTPVGYEIFNLAGGNQPVSILRVIHELEKLLGKKAIINYHPFHNADVKSTHANIEKAAKTLNWRPTVPLNEGLKASVQWYLSCKPWSEQIKLP